MKQFISILSLTFIEVTHETRGDTEILKVIWVPLLSATKPQAAKNNCEKLLGLIQSTLQARKRWIFIWTICLKSIYFLTFYIVLSYIVYHVICIYVMRIFSTIYLCIICMRRSCLLSAPFYGSFFGPSCNRWSPELHLEVLRLWEVHPPQVPPVPSNQPKKTMSTRDESEKHAKRSRVSW